MELFFAVVVGLILPIILALILLIFAARLVTRVVLDELRKEKQRGGPL